MVIERQSLVGADGQGKVIEPVTVNGYDGFSGVHDNLLWTPINGMMYYTLHNKFVCESTKNRQQTIFTESEVRFSCLASTSNNRWIAAAEGESNRNGNASIYMFDTQIGKFLNKFTLFTHGI